MVGLISLYIYKNGRYSNGTNFFYKVDKEVYV